MSINQLTVHIDGLDLFTFDHVDQLLGCDLALESDYLFDAMNQLGSLGSHVQVLDFLTSLAIVAHAATVTGCELFAQEL